MRVDSIFILFLLISFNIFLAASLEKINQEPITFQMFNSLSKNQVSTSRRHGHGILFVPFNSALSFVSEDTSILSKKPQLYDYPENIQYSLGTEKVQRMIKRSSANYSLTNSSNENTERISSTMASLTDVENIDSSTPSPKTKTELINFYESKSIDITKIFNYKEFLNDYELSVKENKNEIPVCRQYKYLPKRLFALDSCAHCYNYVRNTPGLFGHPSKKWSMITTNWIGTGKPFTISVLISKALNLTVFANMSDPESALLSSFANQDARRKWLDCCEAAEKCCERIQTNAPNYKGENSCEATWDGWQCWNETKNGTSTYELCPHYIYFAMTEVTNCPVYAEKTCTSNGNWRVKKNKEWTNYASCGSAVIDALKRRTYVHLFAYAFSIIAIIPALVVFFSYSQLRLDRIILHRNLFASMLVNGIVVIAFKTIVILSELRSESSPTSIINENGVGCRLLFILTKYSRMTNYMWMFCEGYYLHKLIAAAFAEQKSLLIFYLIGWVFPIIPTLIYAIIRMSIDELNDRCWVVPKDSIEWIFNGPSLLSLLINMLFLINIIRVLVTKLRAAHANEPSQYRKAVRATLVLLPLFGLHFVVTIYRPASGTGMCEWLEIYYHINDVLDGLQGFLVALIFCYLNGEVVNLLKRTWGRFREQNFGAGCNRQSSNSQLRSRQSRGGSMLGRSVVSTQCYSSVPASPETCATRLTIITSSGINGGGMEQQQQQNINNSSENLKGKKQNTTLNGIGRNCLTTPNHLNCIVKNNLDSTWTEVQFNDLSSPDGAPTTSMEMKSQVSPTVTNTNGIKGEHQL